MSADENQTGNRPELAGGLLTDRALAGWEIASVTSSILIAEWIASAAMNLLLLALAIPVILAFTLSVSSHRVRKEDLRELGFRFDNFGLALLLLIGPMIVMSLIFFTIGWWSASGINFSRWHVDRPLAAQLLLGFVWGFVQQYMLQSFINRRAQIIWGKGWPGILLVAFIFAGLHLPNLWLCLITFVGGLIWATVFQRAPNLFALAVSHSLMTWILVSTLPASFLNHLRVGANYFF